MLLDEDREIVDEFIAESIDTLTHTEEFLTTNRESLSDKSKLDDIFRTFHSIKGSSGFIGLTRTQQLASETESFVDRFRKDELEWNSENSQLILNATRLLHKMMLHIKEHMGDTQFNEEPQNLIENLKDYSTSLGDVQSQLPQPGPN